MYFSPLPKSMKNETKRMPGNRQLLLFAATLLLFQDTEGFQYSSVGSSKRRGSFLLHHGADSSDDFDSLYEEHTSGYGNDLAKEFQREQQTRTLQQQDLERLRKLKREIPNQRLDSVIPSAAPETASGTISQSPSSPGFFNQSRSSRVTSMPTTATRRTIQREERRRQGQTASYDPWAKAKPGASKNGDNILLIMSASMTAYTSSQMTQPALIVMLGVFVLWITLSAALLAGDDSPLMTTLLASEGEASSHSTDILTHIHGL